MTVNGCGDGIMFVNIEGDVTGTCFWFKIHAKLFLWIAGAWIFGPEVLHTDMGSKTQTKIHRVACNLWLP